MRFLWFARSDQDTPLFEKGSRHDLQDLRTNEYTFVSTSQTVNNVEYTVLAGFNSRKTAMWDGILGMLRTLFVCMILFIASYFLSNDSETLVIQPIQEMLGKVNKIAENPLRAAELEIKDADMWDKMMQKNKATRLALKEKANYEPSVLQKVITKIGALLAIGFGEAGSDIIAANMNQADDVINPMLPG